jgi:iron complex transport system permease protein
MGDLSAADIPQVVLLAVTLIPCFILIFLFAHTMNLLLMGREMALSMGINIKAVTVALLLITSFMVSITVSFSGLLGFVGLVIPHLMRLVLGPDHRLLVPACLFGGGAYLVFCDLLSRTLPQQGEMPAGVVTALIGAPVFIFLLKRSNR